MSEQSNTIESVSRSTAETMGLDLSGFADSMAEAARAQMGIADISRRAQIDMAQWQNLKDQWSRVR